MRVIGHLRALVLGTVAALIVGCATYKEPEASAPSAMIKGKNGCIIDAVDGTTTGGGLSKVSVGGVAGSMGGNEVRVPPGLHTVAILQQVSNGQWRYNFRLECVAKHTYVVESRSYFGGDFAVTDTTTGQILNAPPVLAAPTTAPAASPVASSAATPAPAANGAVAQAAPAPDTAAAPAPSGTSAFVRVAAPKLSDRTDGIHLLVPVTLNYVENIPFTLHAYLAGADGRPLTDNVGKIDATRLIHTSDDTDTDDYNIVIPATRMSSIHINTAVQVRVELLDAQGRIVSQAAPIPTVLDMGH